MKDYLVLHYGFEMPTPEEMALWNGWFTSIADRQVDRAHLPSGREISDAGLRDLPLTEDSITGFTIIRAESFDEATEIARACPYVDSTRVYEISRQSPAD